MTTVSRDEFSERTRRLLEDRVRSCCSNPDCRCPTSGPGTLDDRVTRVGCASHITAASPGGPRYNPNLSSNERRSVQNGIWLCRTCGTLVDADESAYPVDVLVQWKAYSEYLSRCELEGKVDLLIGDACGFCGTVVLKGLQVCTGCSAEAIAGSSEEERLNDFRQSASLAGLATFMLLGTPSIINSNYNFGLPDYWGMSVLAVIPVSVLVAFVAGHFWSMKKDSVRREKGIRFFRRMQA